MDHPTLLSAESLRERLSYDPSTGDFTYLARTWPSAPHDIIGKPAGTVGKRGYRIIRVEGKRYLAHRLAWLYMTGAHPTHDIDHINGVREDNRWANLRQAPKGMNHQNLRHARSDNSTGLLGAFVDRTGNRIGAQIKVDGRTIFLGWHRTAEDAHAAYLAAKRQMHPFNTL